MNIKLFTVAMGIALSATAMSASAQKKYTEGTITLSTNMMGQTMEAKSYFRSDSTAFAFMAGPANIKLITDAQGKSFVVLVDVSAFNVKKAAVATPDEVDQAQAALPSFTFAPTSEAKQISGFNCKKVVATDSKTKKTYDVWITNDVQIPETSIVRYYRGVGGFPVQYTSFSDGRSTDVTVKTITEGKVPAGTFGIPADFDRITLDELAAMRGGGGK